MIQKDSTEAELSGAEHEILGLPTAASPPGHSRLALSRADTLRRIPISQTVGSAVIKVMLYLTAP